MFLLLTNRGLPMSSYLRRIGADADIGCDRSMRLSRAQGNAVDPVVVLRYE